MWLCSCKDYSCRKRLVAWIGKKQLAKVKFEVIKVNCMESHKSTDDVEDKKAKIQELGCMMKDE